MWPITLSGRLPIVGLVGRYLTNYLMGRELISVRYNLLPLLDAEVWSHAVLAPISKCYPPDRGRLLTRYSPVRHWRIATPVRLACVKHAASVRPEPESNSQVMVI